MIESGAAGGATEIETGECSAARRAHRESTSRAWRATFLRARSRSLLARYVTVPHVRLCTCSVVRAELFYGSLLSAKPSEDRVKQEALLDGLISFDFDDRAADAYAHARARVEASGEHLGAMDYAIAAICLANDRTVVTHNVREFSRVPGLLDDDWEE